MSQAEIRRGDDDRLEQELRAAHAAVLRGELHAAHSSYREAQRIDANDPRVLSGLGLTLTLVSHDELKGVAFCEEAIRRGGEDADALWRLGWVYQVTLQRERAVRALLRGLELAPEHEGHRKLLEHMGVRRRPVLPFFARSNPINWFLGRLRHRLLGPPVDASAVQKVLP